MSEVVKNFLVCGVEEKVSLNKVAKQADGAVLLHVGHSVLLATVVSDPTMIDEDFIPLTVQYIEKSYAVGKIPSGFVKRETKPNDFETLTSRIVDRSLRPLFPKGYNYPTQITITVLSTDQEADLQVLALKAASMALFTSDIPVEKMVTGVRIAKIDDQLIANPTMTQLAQSSLDLYVAGSKDELLMIEMMARGGMKTIIEEPLSIDPMVANEPIFIYSANEIQEAELIDALRFAKDVIEASTIDYEKGLSDVSKPSREAVLKKELIDESALAFVKENFSHEILMALDGLAKSERSVALKNVAKNVCSCDHVIAQGWDEKMMKQCVEMIKKDQVRSMILDQQRRADGRACDEVRPITIETNILPMAHGSCLFTRGQTQALVVATLGTEMDKQSATLLTDSGNRSEGFMFHYNFPGYSVGEASRVGAPGRRELGHGNLAKRALEGSIDPRHEGAIRIVSEILESNGSSSMASVCGGSLALAAANVPCSGLVAGVAMGLVTQGDRYEILTDIMGLEDHDGDMDFKVAGTRQGITALQMDIKLGGISYELLAQALDQAKKGRIHILSLMEEAADQIVINEKVLPSTEVFSVAVDKIVEIIGQAGKTIKEIIEKFEVAIDLDRAVGGVRVVGRDKEKVLGAKEYILELVSRPKMGKGGKPAVDISSFKVDDIYTGPVKKVADFGAFVEIASGVEGMVHISKMGKGRIQNIRDVVKEGDILEVKILGINGSKIELGLTNPF